MKTFIRNAFIKPFLPKYEVVCTNYQVIPGLPINRNQSKHAFDRGASQEAIDFYGKVISSEFTKNMAPVEVYLKKRGKVIQKAAFGPVEDLKKFKIAKAS